MATATELRALARRVCEEQPSPELLKDIFRALGLAPDTSRPNGYGWCEDDWGWWLLTGEDGRIPPKRLDPKPWLTSLDAAASLLPLGWRVQQVGMWSAAVLRAKGPWQCIVEREETETGPLNPCWDTRCDHAPTEAQARTAAALLAHAADCDGEHSPTVPSTHDTHTQTGLDGES